MRAHFLLIVSLWATWGLAQGVDTKANPQVRTTVIEESVVTLVYLKPGYTTSVRLPEQVNSVVVGNPLAFKAEHSEAEPRLVFIKPITTRAAESNALITTKNGLEINLHLISGGLAGSSTHVDSLIEFRRPQSLLADKTDAPSFFVPETRPIVAPTPPANQRGKEAGDPLTAALALQKATASPLWQGNSLQLAVGESLEADHQMFLGFSVLNHSQQSIELLPPQIVLNGRSANGKGKEIKADPIGIVDYKITKKRLDPGERADGVVVFERPAFKESAEKIELQVAESGKVDHPVRIPVPFVATTAGGTYESK